MDAASFYLVVESSQTVREALCHVLLSFGIQGIPVPSRAAALKSLAGAEKIEGAVIDIDNSDVDGIALISELKQDERTRGMAIIVHTVQSSKEFVLRMVELGVVGYLLKPFSPDTAKTKLEIGRAHV
jgi:CheY-like chemotaxis protein